MAFTSPIALSARPRPLPSSSFSVTSRPVGPARAARRPPTAVLEKSAPASGVALSQYEQLSAMTTIVEDTGEIDAIRAHRPFAATTNPSLVASAAQLPEYADLLSEAVAYGKKRVPAGGVDQLAIVRNKLFTLFGARILDYIPGDVSTEVDARLSFDADAQVATAHELIGMYEEAGVGRERVLIKLAATWEGVQACRRLEEAGIRTNVTLLFSQAQAAAAAEAGAYLISPFVGRILDWHKKARGVEAIPAEEDPGVLSVRSIYDYYKCHGYETVVMGASFRSLEEILALAGCDRLTIAPKFISKLKESTEAVPRMLSVPERERCTTEKMVLDEKEFRWLMNEDAMATEKLAEGIRGFAKDLEKLDVQLGKLLI